MPEKLPVAHAAPRFAQGGYQYDGAWHGEPGQFRRDRDRLDRLTAAGWRVIFVTAADLRNPQSLLRRIADALGAPTSV
jgi:very-short-patch-repair endonuclease